MVSKSGCHPKAPLEVATNASEDVWDALEREATAHSWDLSGAPGAYQVNTQKRERKGIHKTKKENSVTA